jgi:hypothetical protein
MTTTGLEVRVRQGNERAEVGRFTATLSNVVGALREIDRVYVMRATRATWVVADLSRDADEMIVRLEARPSPKKRPVEDMLTAAAALVTGAHRLETLPEVPPLYLPETVSRIAQLATETGHSSGFIEYL